MSHSHKPSNGLSLAFFLNLIFAIIEFIGGYLTQSTAIIADAFHDLMDSVAIGIAVIMDKFSKKPSSKTFSHGYRRFALLSAIVMSGILLVGAFVMVQHAISAFGTVKKVNSLGMLALAVLGIAINGFAFLRIKNGNAEQHEHQHEHSHNHTHNHTNKKNAQDANSKAILLHLLEDVLGWIAVLIGAIIMYFTKWYWIDAVLAIGIALFISYNSVINLWSTFKILLQAVPDGISIVEIEEKLAQLPQIKNVDKIQIWSIDGINHVVNVQIKIYQLDQVFETQNLVNQILKNYNVIESNIQINE